MDNRDLMLAHLQLKVDFLERLVGWLLSAAKSEPDQLSEIRTHLEVMLGQLAESSGPAFAQATRDPAMSDQFDAIAREVVHELKALLQKLAAAEPRGG